MVLPPHLPLGRIILGATDERTRQLARLVHGEPPRLQADLEDVAEVQPGVPRRQVAQVRRPWRGLARPLTYFRNDLLIPSNHTARRLVLGQARDPGHDPRFAHRREDLARLASTSIE